MGGLLTQPITSKRSDQGKGLGLRYGLSSMQGWRPEMEDAHDVRLGLQYGLDDWSFFAVFDGHAGNYTAAFAAWNLLDFILRDSQFELGAENITEYNFKKPPVKEHFKQIPSIQVTETNNNPQGPNEDNKDQQVENNGHEIRDGEGGAVQEPLRERSAGSEEQSRDLANNEPRLAEQAQGTRSTEAKFASSTVFEQLEMAKNAIRSGFLKIDRSIRISAQDMSGSTAVCAFISPTHLFIANCGDSRAVLFDGSKAKFATEDHKPVNPKERARIIDAGGCATVRINGTLAVSRALGDFEFKKDKQRGPCEQLVSPEPEITVIERNPDDDEFLILACDGIWDVMENQDLCLYVQHMLTIESDLEKICSSILDVCLHKGSRDNMSIILIVFGSEPKVCIEAIEEERIRDAALLEEANSLYEKNSSVEWTFQAFLYHLKSDISPDLVPPGAGIEAKHDILLAQFEKKSAGKVWTQLEDKGETE